MDSHDTYFDSFEIYKNMKGNHFVIENIKMINKLH